MSTENQTNVLDNLVGEGKKFATVEDLVKKIEHADSFIDTLKGENATLRDELKQALEATDRKAALENLMSTLANNTTDDGTKSNQPPDKKDPPSASLSHDDVVKIVEAREREAREARNVATALEPFKKAYGEKTEEALANKAKELGLTVEELTGIAKRSPQAFQSLVGVNRDGSTRSMTNHSSSTGTTAVNEGGGVRNKAYYDSLKKEMGIKAFVLDPKIQVQMHKDRMALGDAWE